MDHGGSWGIWGASSGILEEFWRVFVRILGGFWVVSGDLGSLKEDLEATLGGLGGSLGHFGAILGGLGRILGGLSEFWVDLGSILGGFGGFLVDLRGSRKFSKGT